MVRLGDRRLGVALTHAWVMPLTLVGLTSCFALPPPPPQAAKSRTAETQAYLEGFVVELDGAYTRSDGAPLEMAPGCHVAKTTADSLLSSQGPTVVQWKQVPNVYFRIDALPGHHYRVERSVELMEGKYNVLLVILRTYDPQGNLVGQQKLAYGVDGEQKRPSCSGT